MSRAAHEELDRLVHLAEVHGWHVNDGRAERCVIWFSRGREYAHAGVNLDGEILHCYGGVRGRVREYWTPAIRQGDQSLADLLERAIRADVFDRPDNAREPD
jgi:hypothetical protein